MLLLLEFLEMIWLCVVVVDMSLEEMKKYRWVINYKINKCHVGSIIALQFSNDFFLVQRLVFEETLCN